MVEDQITLAAQKVVQALSQQPGSGKLSTDILFSSLSRKKEKNKHFRPPPVTNESSSDESDSPSMKMLRSQSIQQKVRFLLNFTLFTYSQ